MSDEFHLRRGAHMRHKGELWKVTKFDNGRILIKNLDTDEPDELTLEAWRTGCHEGKIGMVGARRAGLVWSTASSCGPAPTCAARTSCGGCGSSRTG